MGGKIALVSLNAGLWSGFWKPLARTKKAAAGCYPRRLTH